MNTSRNIIAALTAVAALGLAAPAMTNDGVTQEQVDAAKTPADHMAIAAAYDAEAAAAEARAKAHEDMARTYRLGGSPKGSRSSMANHCERLVEHYRAAAEDYRSLAADHRKAATTSSP